MSDCVDCAAAGGMYSMSCVDCCLRLIRNEHPMRRKAITQHVYDTASAATAQAVRQKIKEGWRP